MPKQPAIVIVGPTGSGKSPVGEWLECDGLGGQPVCHFDFGACLRMVADGRSGAFGLDEEQRQVVLESLRTGALLENESFPIAEQILHAVIEHSGVGPNVVLLLNGLPRHVGQAADVDGIVDVRAVIVLLCSPEVVLARIAGNIGGDRTARTDDSLAEIERKLATFEERTLPLIDHYRARGAALVRVPVGADTSPGETAAAIQQAECFRGG